MKTFLIYLFGGAFVGYILGFIMASMKINSLKKTINENEKHAENYLKWLQDTVIRDVKTELQEIKTKMKENKIER